MRIKVDFTELVSNASVKCNVPRIPILFDRRDNVVNVCMKQKAIKRL